MMIEVVDHQFGPTSRNLLADTVRSDRRGATAALETFYFALHRRDLPTLSAVWSLHEFAQLDLPAGGVVRSGAAVTEHYRRAFAGSLGLTVTFVDAAAYWCDDAVVFAGREIGRYRDGEGCAVPLTIRTSRLFGYDREAGRWLQLHCHGSIEAASELAAYQRADAGRRGG
jgi:hypothetical protein